MKPVGVPVREFLDKLTVDSHTVEGGSGIGTSEIE